MKRSKNHTFSIDNESYGESEKWDDFKKFLSQEENVEKEIVANMFAALMRTGLVKQLNVMFPDGKNENPYVLTDLYYQFAEYVMKE